MSAEFNNMSHRCLCLLCEGDTEDAGSVPKYVDRVDGKLIYEDFSLDRCRKCGTLRVQISEQKMSRHLAVASYTSSSQEAGYRTRRAEYMQWLVKRYLRDLPRGARVLDFGSSFGHLCEALYRSGYTPTGVEVVSEVRQRAANAIPKVRFVRDLVAVDTDVFDAAFFIDSLYYCHNPLEVLQNMHARLAVGARIIIRVSNRVWYWQLHRLFGSPISERIIGDSVWMFSQKGIEYLLQCAGFARIQFDYWESGKRLPWRKSFAYQLSCGLATATRGRLLFSPGIIASGIKQTIHSPDQAI